MKGISIILLIILSSFTYSQEPIVAVEFPELNILYRGYSNIVIPAVSNNDSSEIVLGGTNVIIEKKENSNEYIIKPGKERTAVLFVILTKNGVNDTIKTLRYRISNLPDPTLYWGPSVKSGRVNIREKRLFVKYPPEIPMNATFYVKSWQLIANNDTIYGEGNSLSAAEDFLKSIMVETDIEIKATVSGSDGVNRKLNGLWNVIPWKDEKEIKYQIIECGG